VHFLSKHFHKIDDAYHGPEGEQFAIEELNGVAKRFLTDQSRVLEVGCGYGRNLVALARLRPQLIVGSDVSRKELGQARFRAASLVAGQRDRIHLVQQEPYRLPFPDSSFNLVILWQVLEHLFGRDAKRNVLSECVRVLRPGGHILIETPNQWFPFDYHDNKLPLVHWLLPMKAREWVTAKVRGWRYHPSEYLSLPACTELIRSCPGVVAIEKVTRVYFAQSYGDVWRNLSGSQIVLKRILFAAFAPVHALLRLFGSSADLLLPSLRVVWRVEKAGAQD
jgi:SAM-dependent methyltransferase